MGAEMPRDRFERAIDWISRQPVLVKVVLAPFLIVGGLAWMVIGIPYAFVVMLFLLGQHCLEDWRHWRSLRARGRIVEWAEAKPLVEGGSATLVVHWGPKGPGYSWLIEVPRNQL